MPQLSVPRAHRSARRAVAWRLVFFFFKFFKILFHIFKGFCRLQERKGFLNKIDFY